MLFFKYIFKVGVMADAVNPSTQKEKAGRVSTSVSPAWSTYKTAGQPEPQSIL